MLTRARSLFTMALAMALIATVAVPMTAEAKYRKKALPAACKDTTTVEPFWAGKEYKFTPSSDGQNLFITSMATLDPTVGGEYEVAEAKWASLCDPQRTAYLVWMDGVVRVSLFLTYDYVPEFSGARLFGGTGYDGTEYQKLDIETIGEFFVKDPRILDIIAVGRPGTPHSASTLGSFTSSVCAMTGMGCPKKASTTASRKSGSDTSTGGSSSSGSGGGSGTPACTDTAGQPKACPPPPASPAAP